MSAYDPKRTSAVQNPASQRTSDHPVCYRLIRQTKACPPVRCPKGRAMFDGKRREFIAVFAGAALGWPLVARAQQGKRIARIGVLLFGTPDSDPNLPAFLRGLRELGYVEPKNVVIEYRFAEGKPDRLRGLAGELVGIKPDLIFALGGDVAPSARVATTTIPIVVVVSHYPVEAGLVTSLP